MYKERLHIQNSNKEFDDYFEQLASYLNIPTSIIKPYKDDCTLFKYKRRQVIYYSSKQTKFVYFLVNGCVSHEISNVNGNTYLRLSKEHSLFPMNYLFSETTPTYEMCTALTDCTVITLPKDLLEYLCKNYTEIFESLFIKLNETIQYQAEYSMALTANLAKERIEEILKLLCHTIGEDNEEFYEIKQVMTIQLLSNLSGLSRKTTGQVINELKKENMVFQDDKDWIIKKIKN